MYDFDISKLKTIEDYEKAHKEYWTFIAENHLDYKPTFDCDILNNCFACAYVTNKYPPGVRSCKFCPIKIWREMKSACIRCPCELNGELYSSWHLCQNQSEKDQIAMKIADLKFTDPEED